MKRKFPFLLFLTISFFCCNETTKQKESVKTNPKLSTPKQKKMHAYIGTYTRKEGHVDGKAAGIYLMEQNAEDGQLTMKALLASVINPSFVSVSPDGRNLYAVSETGPNDGPSGTIHAFEITDDQSLIPLNQQPSHGFAPCHIAVEQTGRYVLVANYVGGVAAMYPRSKNGSLGEASSIIELKEKGPHPRQESSHPHQVVISPDNRFVFVPDLGSDRVFSFKMDLEKGTLNQTEAPAVILPGGSGPRHLAFHPNGEFAYVISELSSTIHVLAYNDATGAFKIIEMESTLPADFKKENFCADIHVHPNGKFLYGSNRGHDSIVVFEINETDGSLTLVEHKSTRGSYPRNFAIDPNGNYLYAANQNSSTIALFDIDQTTGKLNARDPLIEVSTPVCVSFGK